MTRIPLVLGALLSPFLFPAGCSLLLALLAATVSPLMPLAVGIIIDALYYTTHAYAFPLYTICGVILSITAWLVRHFLETSIMRR